MLLWIIDIAISITVLLIIMPLLLVVMVILKCTGEGEVFYRQKWIGRGGETFQIIKFTTMLKDSPAIGAGTITVDGDPRILPTGRFLRATKINELLQLFNVLKDDMALVGPRPHVQRGLQGVPDHDLKILLKVNPGISGIGSIVFRNEEHILHSVEDPRTYYDGVIAPYKSPLECWAVENMGLRLYVFVLAVTALTVIFPRAIRTIFIMFTGRINSAQILTLMKRCKLGVLPYKPESHLLLSVPNKAAEYFAGNLPIVTSLTDGTLFEVLRDSDTGLFYDTGGPI